ncbi:MAG TPA: GlsB/YeaQ/YmgE family stress response membrane protein [Candidatus Limnocylindrales bacterium]
MIEILAWIVLGAIAGWLAGLLVGGHGLGVIGTIVLGIIGAVVGGFLATYLFGVQTGAQSGEINIASIVVATIGAILVVGIVSLFTRGRASV